MSHPKSFSFDLYPGLDAELEAAYARNVAGGTASAEAIASAGLSAAVAETIDSQDPLASANLPPAFRSEVEQARQTTIEVLSSDELLPEVPELNSSEFANVDWDRLSTAYAAMLGSGLKPEIVVSPSGQSPDWQHIYASLPGTKDGGLYIASEVKAAWGDLNADNGSGWSINVMPATSEPVLKNVTHDMTKADLQTSKLDRQVLNALFDFGSVTAPAELFPDISTYLTLQAIRLKKGEEPIDASTWTWLRGTFDNNTKAPYARWRPDYGQVDVSWRAPGRQGAYLGVRPAVRG